MSSTRTEFPRRLVSRRAIGRPTAAPQTTLAFPVRVLHWCRRHTAWQSYGDAAREIIASSYPQLGWLAPQAAAAQAAPTTIAAATASLDQHELKAVSLGLARCGNGSTSSRPRLLPARSR